MGDSYRFLEVPTFNAEEYVVDKEKSCRCFATFFLIRCMDMFKYKGMPDEVPIDCLNKFLLTKGYGWFTKWGSDKDSDNINKNPANRLGNEQFYFFEGNLGGIPDAYYRPTKMIIANPGSNCYEQFDVNKQKGGTYYGDKGVILRSDSLYYGLMPLILRYSYLLAENVLTMHTADVFLRIIALISAPDDKSYNSAMEYLKGITNGKMGVVGEPSFIEKQLKLQSPPSNNGSYLTQFIEYQQYFLGSFFNEIGLNANFNMKRESIAKSESSLNEDSMMPLVMDMLKCRREDMSVVNELFGTDISVDFNSAWLQNALEVASQLKDLTNRLAGISTNNTNDINEGGDVSDEAAEENQGAQGMVGEASGNGKESGVDDGSDLIKDTVQVESSGEGRDGGNGGEAEGEASGEEGNESDNNDELKAKRLASMQLDEMIEDASGIQLNEEEENKDESSEQ